jgi:ABC-2 type transport system ATP-binding protein
VLPDEDQLILQIPGDGSVASLRRVLGELDDTSINIEHLSIDSPDLDDVFFAVTGRATTDPATGQDEKVLRP